MDHTFTSASDMRQIAFRLGGTRHRDFLSLFFAWKDIAGPIIGQHTSVHCFWKEIVTITVTNSVWMQELVMSRERLGRELERRSGVSFEKIVFRMSEEGRF